VGLIILAFGIGVFYLLYPRGSTFEVNQHWSGRSASLIFDHHTHTSFSDGELTPEDLVALARDSGCDALVVSDHSDSARAANTEQLKILNGLRENYPEMLLFAGLELNMPSYGGREHAGLVAGPSVDAATLQQLRDLAERRVPGAKNADVSAASDARLLQMITDYQSLLGGLLLIYNHPSRKDADILENLSDITRWNSIAPVFSAIEGAPGHQNAPVIGSYEEPYLTEDHWDPVVARVGGVWDQLWSQGHQIWGALASSGYHNERLDQAPCAFSRTHLIVPEQSYRGVIRALKTGTFWADHGRILEQLWFSVNVDGLEGAAYPGSVVNVGARDSMAAVSLSIERGEGSAGQPLTVEIIGNCNSGEAEILAVLEIAPADSTVTTLVPLAATGLDGASCSLRARVRLRRDSAPDYLAYTNPIRLILD